MKKGLSVLLIAAALFGFYGGAVNLNDVLACKDYWEEEGERSTADMNKLEDGLNQLKDNEQAYLDGLEQVADGEEALVQGEEDYAAGQAELAKGEADYAAAPGKLAAGEKELAAGKAKLAAGKAALAQGKKDLSSLNTLIDGVEQVLDGYPEWKSGYEQLKEGRVGSIKKPSDTSQLQSVLTAYAQKAGNTDAMLALQDMQKAGQLLAAQDATKFTNEQYDGFNDYLNAMVKSLDDSNTFFDNLKTNHTTVAGNFQKALAAAQPVAQKYGTVATAGAKAKAAQEQAQKTGDPEDVKAAQEAGKKYEQAVTAYGTLESLSEELNPLLAACKATANNEKLAGAVNLANAVFIASDSKKAALAKQVADALSTAQAGLEVGADGTGATELSGYLTAVGTIPVALSNVNEGITNTQATTIAGAKGLANKWISGYAEITDANGKAVKGQKTLTGGVAQIIGGVLGSGNSELISGMNKAAAAVGFTPKDFTPASTSKLAKDMASGSKLENFYNDMNKIEKGFKKVLPALKTKAKNGSKELAAGKKQVAQGEKDLAAGEKTLAQGYADYAAAPGKLADGRAQLAEGLQKLMDGRKELAAGKEKLGEYEDGEQQVRDGLATLMGTEPDGGLTSILDRRNGDDDFDNGDTHLDLDEGLEAVEVGRGYQADSGVLITKEITNRAIGTAAGLGAGALAVLAAILSFLKKNKGAGISAILSAVAGGAGVAAGTSAGMEFSHIAGSAVGSTPWIAFGVLAGVALVHAIAHFASKEA